VEDRQIGNNRLARAKQFPNLGLMEERYKVCGKLGPVLNSFTPHLPFQLDPGSPDSEVTQRHLETELAAQGTLTLLAYPAIGLNSKDACAE